MAGPFLGAQALGADFAYIGSPLLLRTEANADEGYKQAIVEGRAEGIVYTNLFTGVHGNYLRSSIVGAGLDPDNLFESDPSKMNFGSGGNTKAKAWKDIWGSGQGIGAVTKVGPSKKRSPVSNANISRRRKRLETKATVKGCRARSGYRPSRRCFPRNRASKSKPVGAVLELSPSAGDDRAGDGVARVEADLSR